MRKQFRLFCALVFGLLFGIGSTYVAMKYLVANQPILQKKVQSNKPLYWVAPMDPAYRKDKSGKSPMGMDLVPVYAGEQSAANEIIVSSAVEQSLGVRIAVVKKANLSKLINAVGYVAPDEKLISHIHTYTSGWVHHLAAKVTGQSVQKGQLLFDLYSLRLQEAQYEYLIALNSKTNYLLESSQNKLLALGVSGNQIQDLKRTRKPMREIEIYAPQDGYVSELNIRQGMYVEPKTNVMTLEDLSRVWVIAEFFEQDLNWLKPGLPITAKPPYMPALSLQGTVDYIYPRLDPVTHALRVRLVFQNPRKLLRPDMYVDVQLQSQDKKNVLVIPKEALIRIGTQTRVIESLGKGRYRARQVTSGLEAGDEVEILSGLKSGDRVVISAQFLLDSEASKKASLQRLETSHQQVTHD